MNEVLEVPKAAEWHNYHCFECIVSFLIDWDCDFIEVKNYSTHNSYYSIKTLAFTMPPCVYNFP